MTSAITDAILRPHIPEVWLQTSNSTNVYSRIKDDGDVLAAVDTSGMITFTVNSNSSTLPTVVELVKFSMI